MRLAGGDRFTRSVVDAVWIRVPLVPVIVSDSAHGIVLVVVSILRVEEPEPLIEGGLNPALVMPLGNPDSLLTLRLTGPVNPVSGETVTLNVADPPGTTSCAGGLTAIEKSAVDGVTVIVRVGGLGSEFPSVSITVSEVS